MQVGHVHSAGTARKTPPIRDFRRNQPNCVGARLQRNLKMHLVTVGCPWSEWLINYRLCPPPDIDSYLPLMHAGSAIAQSYCCSDTRLFSQKGGGGGGDRIQIWAILASE